jgi:hypothetical protein
MAEKNFRDVTDDLFSKVGAEDMATELGCSVGAIKQARMDPSSPSHRSPPPGWEKAALKMARDRVAYFTALLKRLSQP